MKSIFRLGAFFLLIFSSHSFAGNIAPDAFVAVSKGNGYAAIDGKISGYPRERSAEWEAKGQKKSAMILLRWQSPVKINQVKLYDRINPNDQILSGIIRIDNGLEFEVGPLDNSAKKGTVIDLKGARTRQLTFEVSSVSAKTNSIGLAEIEVFSEDKPPKFDSKNYPIPVYDEKPGFVELYHKAWEIALKRVRLKPGAPSPLYMDEHCYEHAIWVWDTCFMSLFCRYAPDIYPGVESLENFYKPIHDGVKSSLNIEILDNPPLFSWAEYDTYLFTKDKRRLKWLLNEKQYLQKHFLWLDSLKKAEFKKHASKQATRTYRMPKGYKWNKGFSGMDNTPRGRDKKYNILWVDLLAQQGLSALYISRLAERIGQKKLSKEWRKRYEDLKDLTNKYYWDKEDGFYYDISVKDGSFSKVPTVASFWPMLAEMASKEQAAKLVEAIKDKDRFGGEIGFPTISRNDKDFAIKNKLHGNYWKGGVWLPTSYMGIKALEKYGYYNLARKISIQTVTRMLNTYKNFKPATIWECYSPIADQPSTEYGRTSRQDFCGWSALGPISLFIENIIGIHHVDAQKKLVKWELKSKKRCGIKKLRFGKVVSDLISDGKGKITVTSNRRYKLIVNGRAFNVKAGKNNFTMRFK